ncbi:RidA family protein [Spirosoma taeanense]|uniref:RidA family protein n=1 Tax=Spirosoma taeanense TaxID=2735870 RepID=A0A6M5YAV6_9BACT|nr:RidA family protein [Spirosoma taeanense]QJW90002.1 RidA family protein [Spirosoma taeanense]
MKAERRSILKRLFASVVGVTGLRVATAGTVVETGRVDRSDDLQQDVPLYSGSTRLGNLVFIQGIGAHFEGDVKAHTDHVLKEIEKELVKAGSSMAKVLKVNVLLHDPKDYKAMNEVYKGRFGSKPPVRTTVGVRSGVPNKSLVEMDCIAYV